ncbi:ABC transporter substrate-binding protein [Dactylosporangium sp. CA-092794]|uniref:ABC transporter substrate-binding protein n=1 Tax=Dactylosporangium sp. CA-092794 TaxID=3239929 RepID=UPI003D8B4CAB
MTDSMSAPPRTAVSVGVVAPIFNNMPLWVGQHFGWFAEAGLDVDAEVLYGVGRVTDAVREGRMAIGIGTPESVLSDTTPVSEGSSLRIVAANAGAVSNVLIARRGITSIEDLRGGTIGVSHPREGTALLATEVLARHGLVAGRDVQLAAVGVAEQRWDMIRNGDIDAGLQTPPHAYIADDEGFPNLGAIADVIPHYQFTTLNARRDWVAGHGAALDAFLDVLARGTRWMYDEADATIALAAEVMETSVDYATRDYTRFVSARTLDPELELSGPGMAKVVEVMTAAGTLTATSERDRRDRIDLSHLPSRRPVPRS